MNASRRIKRIYAGLLLLAVLLHAAVPDGFMPSPGRAGMAHMMICPGMAGMHHGADKKGGDDHHAPCPYTPLLAQDVPGAPPAIPVAPVYVAAPAFVVHAAASFAMPKPWFSQGPPVSFTSV